MNINPWKNSTVLITGVCGTVGRELLRQLIKLEPAEIIGLDNNETELFFLSEEYASVEEVNLFLGDIRDRTNLMRHFQDVDVVLHTAALKHVIVCEQSPRDPVLTNVLGTQNVIDAAIANGVKRAMFTSSDKAVNPTNVMGTSKLMGERLITAANAHNRHMGPVFASTRFGNILGSRGSVVPLFMQQIRRGGPVTLTDPEMTRFVMTLREAVRLVMDSTFLARGGEVLVTKMQVVRIEDLAQVLIEELAEKMGYDPKRIGIKIIGSKPGEKLYEELMNTEETRRTIELEQYFVIKPAFTSVYRDIEYSYPGMVADSVEKPYISSLEPCMSRDALRDYFRSQNLLNVPSCEF